MDLDVLAIDDDLHQIEHVELSGIRSGRRSSF